MQFDRTRVAIRQRSMLEIADLATLVARRYAVPLTGYWLVGAIPMFLVNLLLIGWIPWFADRSDLLEDDFVGEQFRYVWLLSILVYLQAPLVFTPMTVWLGRLVFQDRPSIREVMHDLRSSASRWIWTLGFERGPFLAMILLATNWGQEIAPGREIAWMLLFLIVFGLLRFARPFMPEIILLERCPLWTRAADAISASRRSSVLHSPLAGDIVGRQMMVALLAVIGTISSTFTMLFFSSYLFNRSGWHAAIPLLIIPLAMWIVAGACTVMRFLLYLDTRIRLEGWEVELTLRAEAERWIKTDTVTSTAGLAQMINQPKG